MAVTTMVDVKNPIINILKDDTRGHTKNCRILQMTMGDVKIWLHFDTGQELDRYINSLTEARQIR